MTDRYENIRRALEMEPTPGPRRVIDGDSYPYVTVALPENEGRRWNDPIICTLHEDVTPEDYIGFGALLHAFPNARANAALIAACDPDTIRALLEEVERLRAARIAYASEFPATEDGDPDTYNIHSNIRVLKARARRLEEALQLMVEMVEMNGFGRDYAMDVARAELRKESKA